MTTSAGKADETLAALEHALGAGGSRRPALKQWMLDNYDAVSELLAGKRPNWKHLTGVFMDCGYRNNDGSDLDSENVRLMWLSVRKLRSRGDRDGPSSRSVPVSELPSCTSASGFFVAPVLAASGGVPDAPDASGGNGGGAADDDVLAAVRAKMNKRSGRG